MDYQKQSTAPVPLDRAQTFEVAHVFHPLHARELAFVDQYLAWGEDRVCFRDDTGKLRYLPTDAPHGPGLGRASDDVAPWGCLDRSDPAPFDLPSDIAKGRAIKLGHHPPDEPGRRWHFVVKDMTGGELDVPTHLWSQNELGNAGVALEPFGYSRGDGRARQGELTRETGGIRSGVTPAIRRGRAAGAVLDLVDHANRDPEIGSDLGQHPRVNDDRLDLFVGQLAGFHGSLLVCRARAISVSTSLGSYAPASRSRSGPGDALEVRRRLSAGPLTLPDLLDDSAGALLFWSLE
jgi:hypothetical protein